MAGRGLICMSQKSGCSLISRFVRCQAIPLSDTTRRARPHPARRKARPPSAGRPVARHRSRRQGNADILLNEGFARSLHRRMFGDVWQWAGQFRQTERNIGIEAHRVSNDLAVMLATMSDIGWSIQTYPRDEIAVRLSTTAWWRSMPCPNGNGRHARLNGGPSWPNG